MAHTRQQRSFLEGKKKNGKRTSHHVSHLQDVRHTKRWGQETSRKGRESGCLFERGFGNLAGCTYILLQPAARGERSTVTFIDLRRLMNPCVKPTQCRVAL